MGKQGLLGITQAGEVRRPGSRLLLRDRVLRGARRTPSRRRPMAHRRADRHGDAGAGAATARDELREEFLAPSDCGRLRRLHRRVGSRRRLRRGLDQDHRAQGRRRLRHQRRQDVDHQRHAGRLDVPARQHRRRPGASQQVADRRADEDARASGRAQARQARHARLRHRADLLRRRARAAALPHRRRGHGLHLPDAAVPGGAAVGRGRRR